MNIDPSLPCLLVFLLIHLLPIILAFLNHVLVSMVKTIQNMLLANEAFRQSIVYPLDVNRNVLPSGHLYEKISFEQCVCIHCTASAHMYKQGKVSEEKTASLCDNHMQNT